MSPSNKPDHSVDQAQVKPPAISWRNLAIILAISAIVIIGGAVIAAMLSLDHSSDPDTSSDQPLDKMTLKERQQAIAADQKYAITSLTEIYHYQGVNIETFVDETWLTEWGDTFPVKSCLKISGLNDQAIEDKINQKLGEVYAAAIKQYSGTDTTIGCDPEVNFGGLLSVAVRTDDHPNHIFAQLVWRLDTGESPRFNDLFLRGASIPTIIEHAYYKWRLVELRDEWCGEEAWYDKGNDQKFYFNFAACQRHAASLVDMAEIERAVYSYRSHPDLDFFITPRTLTFKLSGRSITLQLESIWDKIAFFKRFEQANLIKSGPQHKSFVFSDQYFTADQAADNLIIAELTASALSLVRFDTPAAVTAKFIATQNTVITEVKAYAAQNPDKMIFVANMGPVYGCWDKNPEIFICSLGISAYAATRSPSALQDIAAGYRFYRAQLAISPQDSWKPDSGWIELSIGSLSKNSLEITPTGEILYWGPYR